MTDTGPFEPVLTDRLLLRCVLLVDAAATSRMITPEVSQWVAYWPVPFTHEMAVQRIEAARKAAFAGNALPFAIVERESHELMGWVMVNRDDEDRQRGTFGYWLGRRFHGHGYMREAAPAALRTGFEELDVDVVEAAAQPGNDASIAVLNGCGFQLIGERELFAPARQRDELCKIFEVHASTVD